MIIQVLGLLCLTSYYYALPTPAHYDEKYNPCLKSTNISIETVDNYFEKNEYDEDDLDLKCFILCILADEGFVTPAGAFDAANFTQNVNETGKGEINYQRLEKVSECAKSIRRRTDPCERAFLVFGCLYNDDVREEQLKKMEPEPNTIPIE